MQYRRLTPDGFGFEHLPGKNALDPAGLNHEFPSLDEELHVANVLTKIINDNLTGLNPHDYDNDPDRITGAQLPLSTNGYVTIDVPNEGRGRGDNRLVIERGTGNTFYTNNHYLSFYRVTFPSPF